jgi:hypothetical protein
VRRLRVAGLLLAVALGVVLAFPGLRAAWEASVSMAYRWSEARDRRPAPPLAWRAGDEARFPRRDFGFVYEDWTGTRIDTFQDSVTKDRVADPDTTVALGLSDAELDTLWREALAARLFDLPEPSPWPTDPASMIVPGGITRLRLSTATAERRWIWDSRHVRRRRSDESKRLHAFLRHVMEMVERHPAYPRSSPARGLYL